MPKIPKMVDGQFLKGKIPRFATRRIFFCSQFIKGYTTPHPNGWKTMMEKNDAKTGCLSTTSSMIQHIAAQVLFTSNGDFLFTTEACSPKADGNPLLMSGTLLRIQGSGNYKDYPTLIPPQESTTTLIPSFEE